MILGGNRNSVNHQTRERCAETDMCLSNDRKRLGQDFNFNANSLTGGEDQWAHQFGFCRTTGCKEATKGVVE